MRYSLSRLVYMGLMLALVVLTAGCSGDPQASGASTPTPAPTITVPPSSLKVGTLSPVVDMIVRQVLTNMHLHAWNPQAMSRGVVTGGLFINWKMSDPTSTNAVRPGPDGNPQHNHDPQVDLYYLTALAEYHLIHPQDHSFDTDLSRTTTLVLADFQKYNLPKGWIYFYLLKDGLMLSNADFVSEAKNVASNLYTRWYDPALGVVYNRNHTSGDYSTDHTVDSGAALIDAGLRWHQPNWVNAGEKTLDHTITFALDPRYHLFYNSMIASKDGRDQVQNYQAKPSTQGEAVDALVTAYTLTHRQQYLDVARLVLQNLFGSSGLWDQAHGGFFFALDMRKGKLLAGYKETRSQTLMLVGLNSYDQVVRQAEQQEFAQQEQQLVTVITDGFYQHTYHGFFYRVTPDLRVYVSKPGAGIGVEDYFTTEAMGSALDALQQTELIK
jgi:hypothetical protein